MSFARARALAGRIVNQFRRDVRTLALLVVVPVVIMALVGYLIGTDGKRALPVGVVNADLGAQPPSGSVRIGDQILAALSRDTTIDVVPLASTTVAEQEVRSGDIGAAIELPSDLSTLVVVGAAAPVRVVVGGIDPGIEGVVMKAVATAATKLSHQGSTSSGTQGASRSVGLTFERVPLEGGVNLSTLDTFAPVLIVMFAFLFTFMLTSVSFLRERSSGTLDRLMASPITRVEVLLGYLLGFIGFAVIQGLVILGYAVWILHVRVAGSIWLVLLTLVILVTGVVNLGIALSFYARNELQVVQFIPLLYVPQIFLGGAFWPVQTLWPPLRWLSQVFPLTHAIVALRAVMVGGEGLGDIAGRLLALLAFTVAMVLFGVVALRRLRAAR